MCVCVCVRACVCVCVCMRACVCVITSLVIHTDHPFGRLYTLTLDPLSSFSDSSNSRRTERGVNGYLGMVHKNVIDQLLNSSL